MLVLHHYYTHTGLESLGSTSFRPVHVVNLEIKDNHEDATLGAFLILKLCNMVRIPHNSQHSCILVQSAQMCPLGVLIIGAYCINILSIYPR